MNMTGINWFAILDVVYHLISYSMLLFGIWLLVKTPLLHLFNSSVRTARIPSLARKRQIEQREKPANAVGRHLELLLKSTQRTFDENSVRKFLWLTGFLVLIATLLFYRLTFDLRSSFLYALLFAALPYLVLQVRLSRSRATASHDLLPAANKLIQKYRANQSNLYFALLELVAELEGPIRQAFFSIIHAIQNRKDVEDAVHLFHYQIHTSWSLQLAILLLDGVMENKTIDNGLERMVRDMTETTMIIEREKSENRDAVQLGYFPIIALPLTVLLNQKLSDGQAFHYHFADPNGRKVLIFTIIICSLSFLAALFMSKPKNDL